MKKSFPLFWRLYLSIVTALLLVMLFFNLMIAYQDQSSYLTDFLSDTAPLAKIVHRALEKNQPWQKEKHNWRTYFSFDVSVIQQRQFDQLRNKTELVERINNIPVLEHPHKDGLIAVYPYKNRYIIISDLEDADIQASAIHQQQEEREEQRADDHTLIQWLSSVLLFVLLALVIYWPCRQINQQVKKLVNTSHKLGEGDLSIRADEQAPAPLDKIAISFNKMAADLNRSAEEQQVMSHAISHELRAPLSKMQLVNSLLSRQPLPDSAKELINDSNRYLDELESLTNQILTLAKINHHLNNKQVLINLTKLVQERVNFFNSNANNIHFISHGENINVLADAFYLQLMLDNLIKNAQKYAHHQVTVRVKETSNRSQNEISIIISDDGPGIPQESRKTVFMPFARLDASRNRDSGGFGLGLAIADAVVRLHHGSIRITDCEPTGAAFIVTLPAPQPD